MKLAFQFSRRKTIFLLLFGLFVLFFILQAFIRYQVYDFQLTKAMEQKREVIQSVILRTEVHPMIHRLDTMMRINRDIILSAYRNKNRKELLENPRIFGLWNQFKVEYPGFSIMHFHSSNGRSFVRMQAPEEFGDDLSDLRKMITQVRETKKTISGYEMGRYGFYFRVAAPILEDDGSLLGVLEFGLDQQWIKESLEPLFPNDHILLFINKSIAEKIDKNRSDETLPSFGDYCLCPFEKNALSIDIPLQLPKESGMHELKQKSSQFIYETADAIDLKDFSGNNIAKVVVFQNTTGLIDSFFIANLLGTVLTLVLLTTILFFGYWLFSRLIGQIESSEKLLENEKLKYQILMQNAGDGCFILDMNGQLIEANKKASQMLGYSSKEMLQLYLYDWDVAHSKEEALEHICQTPRDPFTFETQHRRKDGSLYDASITAVKIDISGCDFIYALVRDISEYKRMEAELRELNATLKQRVESSVEKIRNQENLLAEQSKMAAMGEMIGAIAHQWKQPLNAVSILAGKLGILNEISKHPNPKIDEVEHNIIKQVNFMSQTIDDFRNFFKPNKEKKSFKTSEAIKETLNILSATLSKHNIEVNIIPQERSCEVEGYPNEFKQVVLNLLSNSRDACIENRVEKPLIEIAFKIEEDREIITFKDNGKGIPKELLPDKLFESYTSTKGDKGTGIGLSLAKTIIEMNMGGTLRAFNTEDGAEFVITLPIKRASSIKGEICEL